MRTLLTRGEIAEMMEMTKSQIRFYEKKELIKSIEGDNGYHFYSFDHLDQLELIKMLTDLKIPLKEVKDILEERSAYDYEGLLRRSHDKLAKEIDLLQRKKNWIEHRLKTYVEDQVNVYREETHDQRIIYALEASGDMDNIKEVYDTLKSFNLRHLNYECELYNIFEGNKEYFGFSNDHVEGDLPGVKAVYLKEGTYFSYVMSFSFEEPFEVYKNQFLQAAESRGYDLEGPLVFIDDFKRKFYEKDRFVGTLQRKIKSKSPCKE